MGTPGAPRDSKPAGGASIAASGGTMFAGVLLLVNGILGILLGITAIAKDDVYARLGDYVYKFDLTAWGWIHLILGVLLVFTGLGILKGADWARVVGITLASFMIIANFLWLPYQPVWAIISIAIDVFVVWALCTDHPKKDASRHAA
ncbi:hypothetical protein AB0M39_02670 [Streptomyces sp. NPDC051907]|uniref:DUF7144 family membrane protein n=1 Tax=Streptomyces sp. NPDC051907 TaxID=3155284 RepID=UPI00343C4919